MKLLVNGDELEMPDGTTVATLVMRLGRNPAGLAVAVNSEVVPRSTWAHAGLSPDDRVELLAAAQGG